jgi:SAM-dependent methyltransferase
VVWFGAPEEPTAEHDAKANSIRPRKNAPPPELLPQPLLLRCPAMFGQKLNPLLNDILACPACQTALRIKRNAILCPNCAASFAIKEGVPVFLPEPLALVEPDHISNPIGPDFEAVLREGKDFVLHIGAGATAMRHPNCIEFEHKIFRHTDVVGDAHHLPFRDNTFDRVFAFNVFEHLTDPKKAAEEIRRVLKPGGAVAIHTAFLQALHEEPHHYYNATEYGVRAWFSSFEIKDCRVSGNFAPGVMLAFLMSNLVEAVRLGGTTLKEQIPISESTIGEWAEFWTQRGEPPPGFSTLQNLPQSIQKRIAGGFELLARKPGI